MANAIVAKPLLQLKNCLKNDGAVVKQQATPAYEEACGLAVKHGKMSEARREELLAKIARVASNDAAAFAGTESDVKVSQDGASGDIAVDVVAHWI